MTDPTRPLSAERLAIHCDTCGAIPVPDDWQSREPNHYDWFMPANPTAAVAEYLDNFETKLREALADFYVHDMAQSVLPIIAALRAAERAALPPAALRELADQWEAEANRDSEYPGEGIALDTLRNCAAALRAALSPAPTPVEPDR